jgi:acetylcholinesterase
MEIVTQVWHRPLSLNIKRVWRCCASKGNITGPFLYRPRNMRSSGLYFLGGCLFLLAFATSPVVHSKTGVFRGRHLPGFDQELYLGIKYAPKPMRFAPAVLLEAEPGHSYNVTAYGTDCHGYGSDTDLLVKQGLTKLGEDCLHLNIVKPRTNETGLPVLLWIYGGGWQQGATSDPR